MPTRTHSTVIVTRLYNKDAGIITVNVHTCAHAPHTEQKASIAPLARTVAQTHLQQPKIYARKKTDFKPRETNS